MHALAVRTRLARAQSQTLRTHPFGGLRKASHPTVREQQSARLRQNKQLPRWPCCTLSVLHVGRPARWPCAARPTCAGHKQRGLTCEARFAFGVWRLAILGHFQSDGFLLHFSAYMPASATLSPHCLQMHFEGILRAHTNIVRTQRDSYPRARGQKTSSSTHSPAHNSPASVACLVLRKREVGDANLSHCYTTSAAGPRLHWRQKWRGFLFPRTQFHGHIGSCPCSTGPVVCAVCLTIHKRHL